MASTDARPVPIKNTAYRAYFPILDNTGALVTGAAGLDSERSLDGATFADCTNEATEVATSSGIYYLDLTTTEMNTDNTTVIVKTSTTNAKTTVLVLYPQESGDIKVDVQSLLGTAWATPATAGLPDVNVKQISTDGTAADNLELMYDGTGYAPAVPNGSPLFGITAAGTLSGTHSSTTADLGTNAPANDISGQTLLFPSHKLSRFVDSYNTGTGVATFSPSVAVTLANAEAWVLLASAPASTGAPVPANVTQLLGTAWLTPGTAGTPDVNAKLVGGQTASAAGTVTFPGTIASATNITAGTITTVTNLTNAPTSGDLTATMKTSVGTAVAASAVASVTGNVGGNVTGSVGSLATQAKADVNAEVLDVLTTDTFAEPSGIAAATSTIKDKINFIFQYLRNKRTQTATTETLRNDGDSGSIGTRTVSDDGTTMTKGKIS